MGTSTDRNERKTDENISSAIEQEEGRLLKAVQARVVQTDPTTVLPESMSAAIPDLFFLPFGTRKSAAELYRLVPAIIDTASITAETPVWRIELHGLKGGGSLGYDIVGDAFLGRGDGEGGPDINLEAFDAFQKGVSRRHAMLRPTQRSLYILDLGSTNGTQHNAVPLSTGITRPLQHNDIITLGRLSFTVKIIARPPRPGETPQPADPPTTTSPLPAGAPDGKEPGPGMQQHDTPGPLPALPDETARQHRDTSNS